MVEDRLVVEVRRREVVLGLDLGQRRLGDIGKLVKDGDEVAVLDDPALRPIFSAARDVDRLQLRPVGRRPEDLGVEHAGQPDVAGVLGLARDLVQGVPRGRRLAHDLELGRRLQGGLLRRPPGDRLAPGPARRRSTFVLGLVAVEDRAVPGLEPLLGNAELLGGQLASGRPAPRPRPPAAAARSSARSASRMSPCHRGRGPCRP